MNDLDLFRKPIVIEAWFQRTTTTWKGIWAIKW